MFFFFFFFVLVAALHLFVYPVCFVYENFALDPWAKHTHTHKLPPPVPYSFCSDGRMFTHTRGRGRRLHQCHATQRNTTPDTFASKVAAVQDKYADASVGNVTGSNAVNVFLGIGIAWSMAAIVKTYRGEVFRVPIGR